MSDNATKNILFRVQRFDPDTDKKPHLQEFTVPVRRGTTVLEALLFIKENLDSSLAFRTSCRMGVCGSCGMLINDYPHLACHTQVEEFHSDRLTIKSLPNMPVVKDLVPALDDLFSKHNSIRPYVIRSDDQEMTQPTREYAQTPDQLNEFLQFTYCIKCGLCIAACPTSASDRQFLGPQALAQAYRYCADNRDDGQIERLELLDGDHSVWNCHFAAACSEACPKGVDPGFAIQLLRRSLVGHALNPSARCIPSNTVAPPSEMKVRIPVPEFTVK
jgi:succinate dehydrogenase / fumarate reductase, iron-sulfur subunit